MNEKLKQLALEVGGSHFPEVSRQYLEQTVRLVIRECVEAYRDTRASEIPIEQHFLQRFDLK